MAEEHRIPIVVELRDRFSRALELIKRRLESMINFTLEFQNRLRAASRAAARAQISATKGLEATVDRATKAIVESGIAIEGTTEEQINNFQKLGAIFNRFAFFGRRVAWALTWMQLSFLGLWFQARFFIRTVMRPFQEITKIFKSWQRTLGDVAFAFGYASYLGINFGLSMQDVQDIINGIVSTGLQVQMMFGLFVAALAMVGQTLFAQVLPALSQLFQKIFDLLQTEEVRNAIAELGRGIADFLDSLSDLIDRLPEIIDGIRELWSSLAPLIRAIGGAAQAFISFLPIPQELKSVFLELTDPMTRADGTLRSLGEVLASTATLFAILSPLIMMFMISMNTLVAPILVVSTALDALGGALTAVGTLTKMLGMSTLSLLGVFGIVIGAIAVFAIAYTNNWFGIRDATNAVIGELIKTFQAFISFLQVVFGPVIAALGPVISSYFQAMSATIAATLNSILYFIAAFFAFLRGDWQRGFELLGEIVNLWSESVLGAWSDFLGEIRNLFGGLIDAAFSWGRSLILNFIEGIKAGVSDIVSAITGIGETVADFLGFGSVPSLGPLREVPAWGQSLVQEFAKGISTGWSAIGLPAAAAPPFPTNVVNVSISFTGEIRSESDIERIADELSRRITDRIRQRGGFRW